MDRKTQIERAKAKRQKARPGGFSTELISERGMGRKGKPSEMFPIVQCDYRIGGEEQLIRRKRNNPKPGQSETYLIPLIVGGRRCFKKATVGKRCLGHAGATYAKG